MNAATDRSGPLRADEVEVAYGIDMTTAEVMRHALEFVALQMQVKVNTAALSPMLSEANDFGIGLLGPRDPDRDLDFDAVAMATAAPAHYIINQFYARTAIEHWGVERFEPGDILIYNDPYAGGSHVNDLGTVCPIFADDGELMGFATAITHWLDIGGPIPGGMGAGGQRDMYSEGLRLTPRKLASGGELVRETVELFTLNTRIPEISSNDLQVLKSALELGVDMSRQYIRRYGKEAYKSGVQYTVDYSERAARRALAKIPDGEYTTEDFLDHDMEGRPMPLVCTVRKYGEDIEIDYSDSCRAEWGGFASQWSDTVTGAHLGVQVMLPETISPNAGAYRPVEVVVPPGSCFHALPPMSTNAGHALFIPKARNLLKAALSQASPEIAVAENWDDLAVIGFSGIDPRDGGHDPFVYLRVFLGPYGGTYTGDGCCYSYQEGGNVVETSAELDEEMYPFLILSKEFVTDTSGAGKHRGGPAARIVFALLTDVECFYQLDQCRYPTKGILGGEGGSMAHIRMKEDGLDAWCRGELGQLEVIAGIVDSEGELGEDEDAEGAEFRLSKRSGVHFKAGDVIVHQVAGAGGYGPPAERESAAVEEDIRNELITAAYAATHYGHAVDGAREKE